MDQGGYYNSQSYGGYGDYMSQQGYYNVPSISPCTTQAPPPNSYHDAQFQNPYPPQSYQDSPYHSQPPYHNPYPQQYQDPQYAFYDQYPQCSQDYNPPQHPFPPQDYSPNPYPSPIHYTPYPQDTQPSYDHHIHSPSVGKFGVDEETLALVRRWGVTIVRDDDIEDEGYPMRPSEDEYANNQWEPQEPLYQEPQQECQPFDQDPEMKFMMSNMLKQMNEQQVLLDNMMAQIQGLTTQEPVQELFSKGEVLQELFLPNEGHVVEEKEKICEDLEDEDDEVYDECIDMETPSWGEIVHLQGNGDKEQLEDGPIEEVQENDGVEEKTKDESVEEEEEENMEVGDKDHIENCPFEEKCSWENARFK
ncbi:PREDICTED: altered inheritance of mitochondria protein 3-like [Ipomoea nil]|uniref:altered inheritance of mitochondria protein 3-like n=1 Tax=Ipomoea nil TaxID=35883 RepID=UPI0009012EEA|nr:PREDICTED: altered inheritance of mitochondria protein 3-like [Ipomoea nil]